MTYIAAFECLGGIVMCADTQETYKARGRDRDEKEYVEKLYVPENPSYPISVGGAGLDEPIEAFSLELFERVEKDKPATIGELRTIIQAAIEEVHKSDAVISAWPSMYRTTKCIVAAKPTNEEFTIFVVTGKRVSCRKREPVIIGYDTPANSALLRRLYRRDLSIQQGVILALYLVAQSKAVNEGVGFDTRVAVITQTGAWLEPSNDIKDMEARFAAIAPLVDQLLLAGPDIGMTERKFGDLLEDFQNKLSELRSQYKDRMAEQIAQGINWPYEKLPAGCRFIQSFDNTGKRTMAIYSDPSDPNETWALRTDRSGLTQFKQTATGYISEKVYQHLIACPSSNLKECIEHIGLDC